MGRGWLLIGFDEIITDTDYNEVSIKILMKCIDYVVSLIAETSTQLVNLIN